MNKNVQQLHKQIVEKFRKDLIDVLNSSDVRRLFFDSMTKAINEEVYDRYEPTQYIRRYKRNVSEGLNDEANYDYKVIDGGNSFEIYMRNMAKGDGGASDYLIDTGIVEGKNFYDWEWSKIYKLQQSGGYPRDFYGHMEEQDDTHIKNLILSKMERKGWTLN